MYKIVILQIPTPKPIAQMEIGEQPNMNLGLEVERYSQTVDDLDLPAVIAMINGQEPPRKKRKDAGTQRGPRKQKSQDGA